MDIGLKEAVQPSSEYGGLGHAISVAANITAGQRAPQRPQCHWRHRHCGLPDDVPEKEIQDAMATYAERLSAAADLPVERLHHHRQPTYNAGPESTEAALRVLGDTSGTGDHYKRIAVLGDMLELGNHASA